VKRLKAGWAECTSLKENRVANCTEGKTAGVKFPLQDIDYDVIIRKRLRGMEPAFRLVESRRRRFMNARDATRMAEIQRFAVPCLEWQVDEAVRVEICEARSGQRENETISKSFGRADRAGGWDVQGMGSVGRGQC
jgi:hypothetical protein